MQLIYNSCIFFCIICCGLFFGGVKPPRCRELYVCLHIYILLLVYCTETMLGQVRYIYKVQGLEPDSVVYGSDGVGQ